MTELPVDFVADASSAERLTDASGSLRGVEIDTRRLRGGNLFFALAGERTDGHAFLTQALDAGAAGLVIHHPPDADLLAAHPDVAWLRVEDTYTALHDLTRAVRRRLPEKLAAITGSAGKTTTKELLAALLARRFRTERSPGNFNNLYGFPLALLNIADDCQWMVAEMGMSTPGELGQVSRLGRPDVAIFTNVRPVHLENFPNLRGIAEAKAELLHGLVDGGLVIYNADDPEVVGLVERHAPASARRISYGFAPLESHGPADVHGADLQAFEDGRIGSRFEIQAHGERATVELPVHGLYNAENFLAAATCALQAGVPLDDIVAAAAAFQPHTKRGEVHRPAGGPTVIDDSYNSNPDAAIRALDSAKRLPAQRRWAVLGDMLELGPDAEAFHAQVGERAAALGFDVVGVGPLSSALVEAARRSGGNAVHLEDAEATSQWLLERFGAGDLGPGDLVLIKGSRGIGLDVASRALLSACEEHA